MTALPLEQAPQPWGRAQREPFNVIGGQQFGIQTQPIARDGPQPRRGMFAGGGRKVLSAIAETAAAFSAGMGNPAGMQVLQNIQGGRQRLAEQEAQAAQYEKQREDGYQDWVRRQMWELQNRPAASNDTVADYNFILEKLGPDAANRYLSRQGDPIITTTLPGNRFFSGPSSQLAAALGAGGAGSGTRGYPPIAPEAVADLKADPSAAAEFDEVFGPGAAARVLGQGGQSVAPTGGFR